MNQVHKELMQIGNRILSLSRSELYLSLRYLDLALSALSFDMDLRTRTVATDGIHLFYNPTFLASCYRDDPVQVNRTYLHLILHGIFHHLTGCGERDIEDWNLACDIAVESVIDSMDYDCIRQIVTDRKKEYYAKLNLPVFNAEQIYTRLRGIPYRTKEGMRDVFTADDHQFWDKLEDDENTKKQQQRGGGHDEEQESPPDKQEVEQKWQDISQKTQTAMETFHQKLHLQAGDLLKQLHIENRTRVDYRKFLEQFAALREEVRIDPDSFDYGFYSYGLQLYGNIPLMEELEYCEEKKIRDFVIAIDTSGSCSEMLMQRFLEQTVSMLLNSGTFSRTVNVHILQCDAAVQSDLKITDLSQLHDYMQQFDTTGNGDTDFRPVFAYVDDLIKRGDLTHLQGLLFFTDGYGIFPIQRPAYDTAFVFLDDSYGEHRVPPWAIRLVIGTDDINNFNEIGR